LKGAAAHNVTRANDFSGLSALLRNFRAPFWLSVLRFGFAKRNETFRWRTLKSLKTLRALNQPFRGFLCYQGLTVDFVSLRSRAHPRPARQTRKDPLRTLMPPAQRSEGSCGSRGRELSFGASIANIP
jgi:hypothetical protein